MELWGPVQVPLTQDLGSTPSVGKSQHSWIQTEQGTWLYQASVWPMVRSHCVLPEPRLCLRAGEGEMPPLVRVAVEGS